MTREELIDQIKLKKSFLCVGLDTDLEKIPSFLLDHADPIFEFNKRVIDATKDHCVAFKANIAFYECMGSKGWDSLKKTLEYIPKTHFSIADAKRGDIGNTSKMYAKTFFEYMDFDSVTVAPYMGEDSVSPFLEFDNKWVILLALTSNVGAQDFQFHGSNGKSLFETVIRKAQDWGNEDNLMYVAGATRGEDLRRVRDMAKDHFLLVPGVGAQGGSLREVVDHASIENGVGLLVNSSRGIIYAGSGEGFADDVKQAAISLQHQMQSIYF